MISALFPGFLAAGTMLAVAPLVLHLLARRPPDREPLPTARFLREDARTLLRLQRRPTDLLLLAVRVLFALTLGAAFAGVTWTPGRVGTGRIVLLDAGADPRADWNAVIMSAQRAASATPGGTDVTGTIGATGTAGATSVMGTTGPSDPTSSVILAYGLDDGYRIVAPEDVGGLTRGSRSATAEDGLRALRSAALSETLFERAEVIWVTRLSWTVWSPGVGLLRPELWPGRVTIHPIQEGSGEAGGGQAGGDQVASETNALDPLAASIPAALADGPLRRALDALGAETAETATSADWIFAGSPVTDDLTGLLDESRPGTTTIFSGPLADPVLGVPWNPDAASTSPRGGVVLPMSVTLGAPTALGGTATPGARIVAVFEDATPAATAVARGGGCIVYLAASIEDPALVSSGEYPDLIDHLGRACSPVEEVDGPLDRGAIHALERSDLPLHVDLEALAASQGVPLGRWMALLAVLLLATEVGLTRGRAS